MRAMARTGYRVKPNFVKRQEQKTETIQVLEILLKEEILVGLNSQHFDSSVNKPSDC